MRILWLLAGLVGAWPGSGLSHAAPVVLIDDAGRTVRLAAPPLRIVSLVPSLTEVVCVLDACDRLVATDDFSNWPAAAAAKPKVGGIENSNVEQIVRQRPQLVLLGRFGSLRDRLDALGIPTFVLDPVTYRDVGRTITVVAAILGEQARGAALCDEVQKAVDSVAAQYRAHTSAPVTVYFEIDSSPYAAGPQSFIGELLSRLGARNIVAPELGLFPKLNPEYVVLGNPDVILLAGTPAVPLAGRPGWDRITALRRGQVCDFPPAVADTIMRPGPRVADGMRAIAACLARYSP
jgi:iron complex transport system substrate-binding protein